MKRLFVVLAAAIVLCVAGIYILIPGKITIARSIMIHANRDALLRKMQTSGSWSQWWPETGATKDTPVAYSLHTIRFSPGPPRMFSVPVNVETQEFSTSSEMTFFPHNFDSTTIHVESTIVLSANPVTRVRRYFQANKLADSFNEILESVKKTYSNISNLYDYDIQKKLVVDSILISTFEEMKSYPSINKVYELIDRLKEYNRENGAKETGFPMLNISTNEKMNYILRVAIPVNKRLPPSGNISSKWMLPGGNILVTEVKGGPSEINKAYKQIQNYLTDYSRTPPAIPFESLVTDRRNEPDTSKWITRIYYPIM